MRKLVAALGTCITLVAGLALAPPAQAAAAAAPSAPAYTPPSIAWAKCTNPSLSGRGGECGLLTVPLDYAKPGGQKIKLAVSRIKHKTAESAYQGVMLVNPGGPGGSGLTLAALGEYVPNGAGDAYDWIGFDPRGVGDSQPSLSCDGNYFSYNRPYYVPVSLQLERTWLQKAQGYAAACASAGGALLDHMKTTDSVADMESIRLALKQDQINYYGFSYGTYLGQVYATLHPDRMRRFVLDSNVNPRDVWNQANFNQDVAFEKNIKIYFDWVAKYDSVYHLGTDGAAIERTYYRILNQLRTSPAAGGTIGPDEWTDVFLYAGYYVFVWEDIANAFSAAVNQKDYSGIKTLYDNDQGQGPGADNGYAVYNAVQCTDAQWPTSKLQFTITNWIYYTRAPFETWGNAWYNAPCLTWAAKAGKPVDVSGAKAPPVLLIDETNDAATPYSGSLLVRQLFPKSVLIEGVGGTTHAGSLSGVACVDDAVAAYLSTGALPARVGGNRSDLQCSPVPQPDPTAVSADARSAAPDSTAPRQQLLATGVR